MPDTARDGFSLVEVMVALTLLSIGVLAIAASGLAAARIITAAHQDEYAAVAVSALVDSLVAARAQGSAEIERGHLRITWSAILSSDSLIRTIHVSGRPSLGTPRTIEWTTVHVVRR